MGLSIPLITVLGTTAVGKTTFAARLASALDTEIISADSRQVFKGMDIGTGKDLNEYWVNNKRIPTHLIDIAEPGSEYNVFRFQHDFSVAFNEITSKGKTPILCGGTGLYIESVLSGYQLIEVPINENLRKELGQLSYNELVVKLSSLRMLHNSTDILDRERMLRAIEIEIYKKENDSRKPDFDLRNSIVFGILFDRKTVRSRITQRLLQRLDEGMIEEVERLLDIGISAEKVKWYGLEYKYVAMFILGELNKNEMFALLNTAIHQFAKRQMTWFRRMEKNGIKINWLEGENGLEENLQKALHQIDILIDDKK